MDKSALNKNQNTIIGSELNAKGNISIITNNNYPQKEIQTMKILEYSEQDDRERMAEEIRQLIGKNRIKQAIEQLNKLAKSKNDKELLKQVVMYENQWKDVITADRIGTISSDEVRLKKNKIIASILDSVGENC